MTLDLKTIQSKTKIDCLDLIKRMNLSGCRLNDVSILSNCSSIVSISLTMNQISSLKQFSSCLNLEELYLRKNNITDLSEVCHLSALSKLHILWLDDNPIQSNIPNKDNNKLSNNEIYKSFVHICCSNLTKFDNLNITDDERSMNCYNLTYSQIQKISGNNFYLIQSKLLSLKFKDCAEISLPDTTDSEIKLLIPNPLSSNIDSQKSNSQHNELLSLDNNNTSKNVIDDQLNNIKDNNISPLEPYLNYKTDVNNKENQDNKTQELVCQSIINLLELLNNENLIKIHDIISNKLL